MSADNQHRADRNAEILRLYLAGAKQADLARDYGFTRQRVGQLLRQTWQRAQTGRWQVSAQATPPLPRTRAATLSSLPSLSSAVDTDDVADVEVSR